MWIKVKNKTMSANELNTNNINEEWKPKFSPWLIAIAVMIATAMQSLDSTIANIALPNMAGTFSATNNEILWVITSYLISSGVILPSAGWFSSFLGRKKFLLICVIIFTVASIMCGLSTNLTMMVFARILQGIGGGALMPIAQSVLLESFPVEKRSQSMAIFGLGVIMAPIFGPVLGGWITDNYSWHWIFFINVPIGILAITLISMFVEDPPYIKANSDKKIDYVGFGALIVWLVCMQIVFDTGQKADWFQSNTICWLSAVSILAMIFFIAWELKFKDSIIDLKVFKDQNYSTGALLSFSLGAILYCSLSILPLCLQTLLGYSAMASGLSIMPRGVGAFISFGVVGFLSNKMEFRLQIAIGFLLLGISNFMLGNINLSISQNAIIIPNLISGLAMGFMFIPITTAAFTTLTQKQIAGGATGVLNLLRNIGGGIGTALVSTFLVRNAQLHQTYLVQNLTPLNPIFQQRLQAIQGFLAQHMDIVAATHKANALIYNQLLQQANLFSYVENFRAIGLICLIMLPSAFLFKKIKMDKN